MSFYTSKIQPLFFGRRFYWSVIAVIMLFIVSYYFPWLYQVAQIALLFIVVMVFLDYSVLFFRKSDLEVQRDLPERFSNGDINKVHLVIRNLYPFKIDIKIIDEIPEQFQKRNFFLKAKLSGDEQQ